MPFASPSGLPFLPFRAKDQIRSDPSYRPTANSVGLRRRPPTGVTATQGQNRQHGSPGAYKKAPLHFFQLSFQSPLQAKKK